MNKTCSRSCQLIFFLILSCVGWCADHATETANLYPNNCPSLDGLVPVANSKVPDGYCAFTFTKYLNRPRGIRVYDGKLMFVQRGQPAIGGVNLTKLFNQKKFSPDSLEDVHSGHDALNHGICFDKDRYYLYASNPTTVYRWRYDIKENTIGRRETVVEGIPSGGHSTRTLVIRGDELLVAVGSGSNVDHDNHRSRIIAVDITNPNNLPVPFSAAEPYAVGTRNEVGIALDELSRLWGVENGVDNLRRTDFRVNDIHSDNPGEELNLFERGGDYGYPHCWSEYNFAPYDATKSRGQCSQWAQPDFMSTHSDEWCIENSKPPQYVAQAHMAPLGLLFDNNNESPFGSPGDAYRTAFVPYHGSWNRQPAVGYRVDMLTISKADDKVVNAEVIFAHDGPTATTRGWARPVDVALGPCHHFGKCLYFTDDQGGKIVAIGKNP